MPFLSRIWINPLRGGAQNLLRNPQAMHAAVLGGVSRQPVTERVLWRIDADVPQRPGLFVLTHSRPSWEHLVEQASWPSADTPQAQVRDYAPLLDKLETGRRFAFRLTANPTQSTRRPDKLTPTQQAVRQADPRRSHRVGHRTVAHQLGWLLDRVESWGARIPEARSDFAAVEPVGQAPLDVRVSGRQRLSFLRKQDKRVTLQQVTYEGHLVVQDPKRLADRLLSGIGRGKAYGCGLLTLAPSEPGGEQDVVARRTS